MNREGVEHRKSTGSRNFGTDTLFVAAGLPALAHFSKKSPAFGGR